jgi:hypothetical protein
MSLSDEYARQLAWRPWGEVMATLPVLSGKTVLDLKTLALWKQHLRPGGWIALTEIDDFFAHEPVEAATRSLLDEYVKSALAAKRQDFLMGRKLRGHLEAAGFDVVKTGTVIDPELSFDGPAERDVLDAWRARLARMKLLQEQCGAAFDRVRDDFLAALSRDDHRCRAKVYYCIATLGRESEARSQG